MAEPTTESSLTGRKSWGDKIKRGLQAGFTFNPITGPFVLSAMDTQWLQGKPVYNPFTGMLPGRLGEPAPPPSQPDRRSGTAANGPVSGVAQGIVDSIWPVPSAFSIPPSENPEPTAISPYDIQRTASGVGNDAYSQYMDEMTDRWRLQQDAINAQYDPRIAQQNDTLADLQGRRAGSTAAYDNYMAGIGALDTDIPYGAIADLDTSRVSRQFDEAEGRIAQALNLSRDEFSEQMVGEIRYFEDVTETMLADDIENTERLHDLGGVYAQAIADEAYGNATLEGERAKLEMQAMFDRSIYEAQREKEQLEAQRLDSLKRNNDAFQMDYPDFNLNRDAVTQATYTDTMKQQGVSEEDAQQGWDAFKAIYDDPNYANRIYSQKDFNDIQRGKINYGTVQYLSPDIWSQIEQIHALDPSTIDPLEVPNAVELELYHAGAIRLFDWMERHDVGALFTEGTPEYQNQFMRLVMGAGVSREDAQQLIEDGIRSGTRGDLVTYRSEESKAARQAFATSNTVDDHWEDIYYDSMTIPVDSKYVHQDPTSKAIFPVAGPEVAFDQVGNVPASKGTPVVSMKPGRVTEVGYTPENGYYIRILHKDGSEAQYAHLEQMPHMAKGDQVSAATSIGRVGNSGSASTDPYGLFLTYWDASGVRKDPSMIFGTYGAGA